MSSQHIDRLIGTNYNETNFRLNARNVFLTYPQCPITKEFFLQVMSAKFSLLHWTIGEEKHEDGEPHIHACLTFQRKLDLHSASAFDIAFNGTNYHPHIQKPRNLRNCHEYCRKNGSFITNIEDRKTYQEIFSTAVNKTSFLQQVQMAYPRDYALNLARLEYCADQLWPKEEEIYQNNYNHFNIPTLLTNWLKEEVINDLQDWLSFEIPSLVSIKNNSDDTAFLQI